MSNELDTNFRIHDKYVHKLQFLSKESSNRFELLSLVISFKGAIALKERKKAENSMEF